MDTEDIIISQTVFDKIKDAKGKIFHFQGGLYKFNKYNGPVTEKYKYGGVYSGHSVNVTEVGNDPQELYLDQAKKGGGKRKRRGRKSKHKQSRKSKKRKSKLKKSRKSRKRSKTRRR